MRAYRLHLPRLIVALALFAPVASHGGQSEFAPSRRADAAACLSAPSGLVSWWPGDGNAIDIAGGNFGTLFGNMSFTNGEVGQAFSFNGIDGHVRIPPSSNLAVQSITIEAWIFPTDLGSGRPIVEYSADSGSWAGVHFWVSVPQQGGTDPLPGSLFMNIRDVGGGNHALATTGAVLTADQWNHVAMTYDGQTGLARLYVNGNALAEQNLGTSFTPNTSVPVYIGLRPAGSFDGLAGSRFVGRMDEVSIYSRALTATEVQSIFNAGSAGKCKLSTLYSIYGRVTGGNNQGTPGATVSTDTGLTAITDAGGYYTITTVLTGTYALAATAPGHDFWPPSQLVTLGPSRPHVDFSEWLYAVKNVPLYLQGDPSTPPRLPNHPRWYTDTYGSPLNHPAGDPSSTVGMYGCAMASAAMIISHFGQAYQPPFTTDPGVLNAWLRAHQGYDSKDGIRNTQVISYSWRSGVSLILSASGPRDDARLDSQLQGGWPATLNVTTTVGDHYVVVTGKTIIGGQATYTLNDPALGYTTLLASYHNNYKEAFYYGLGPTWLDRSGLEISAHSPVHLVVTDPLGRKVGFDPRTNTTWNDIPNAGYNVGAIAAPDGSTLPETKVVLIPQPLPGRYTVEAIGTGDGPYELLIDQTDPAGSLSETSTSGSATTGSVSTFAVTVGSRLFLPAVVR